LVEIFKSMDRNSSIPAMRGFYVMRMKKDERTGHYFGVATWISKDQPLHGSRILKSVEPVKPVDLPEPSKSEYSAVGHQSDKSTQIEDSRSEFNRTVEKFSVERKPNKSTFFDPYEPYEL
jgi:hypothetical protein